MVFSFLVRYSTRNESKDRLFHRWQRFVLSESAVRIVSFGHLYVIAYRGVLVVGKDKRPRCVKTSTSRGACVTVLSYVYCYCRVGECTVEREYLNTLYVPLSKFLLSTKRLCTKSRLQFVMVVLTGFIIICWLRLHWKNAKKRCL
jgi:hypothetical protein